MAILDSIRRAWNAFKNPIVQPEDMLFGSTTAVAAGGPGRPMIRSGSERSIMSSIYNKLSMDAAGLQIKHVKVNKNKQYLNDATSALNLCLTLEPNVDQGPRSFRQDVVMTMFDRGVAAIVPIDTASVPDDDGFTDIFTLRVGDVLEWFPKHVRVNLWNEEAGIRQEITLPKRAMAIAENPLYIIMNDYNSTLQRLIRKLHLLDSIDEASGSGKLDILVQLPYTVRSEARKQQAEQRRDDIELQLRGSQYGIAYVDGAEKITQLNRPAENNLMAQIEKLIDLLYSQLGLTESIMNGTADEATMNNYYNRTIIPIVVAIVEAMHRSFVGTSGVTRDEAIQYFRTPFQFTSAKDLAELADKLIRNTVATPNDFRSVIGLPPSTDPKADELRNPNMPEPEETPTVTQPSNSERIRQNGS